MLLKEEHRPASAGSLKYEDHSPCAKPHAEEKTRNGILSTLRIRGDLGSAVALDDIQDGVLVQPEPVTYFRVRLAFVDKL